MKTNIITKQGLKIEVQNGFMPYFSNQQSFSGQVRYVGQQRRFEVFDGSTWLTIPDNTIELALDEKTKQLLSWVEDKIEEEKLANTYPAVRAAKDHLDMLKALVKDYSTP